MIRVEDFAKPADGTDRTFHFGLDKPRVLDGLRRLIDDIEAGNLLVSGVTITAKATVDDFTTNVLAVEYHIADRKAEPPPRPEPSVPFAKS